MGRAQHMSTGEPGEGPCSAGGWRAESGSGPRSRPGGLGGVPAGEEVECAGVAAAGCDAAHDEGQAVVGGEFHRFVIDRQLSDQRVVESFGARAVAADFVSGPALAEGVAADGEFADQVGQGLVVGVAADLGAQGGDVLVGDGVPVGVELGGGRVQEGEAGGVDRPGRAVEDRREQCAGEGVANTLAGSRRPAVTSRSTSPAVNARANAGPCRGPPNGLRLSDGDAVEYPSRSAQRLPGRTRPVLLTPVRMGVTSMVEMCVRAPMVLLRKW